MTVDFLKMRGGADAADGVTLPDTKAGTATSVDVGTQLTDTAARFKDDNVERGMTVSNITDGSTGVVTEVVSQTVLNHTALSGGAENDWDIGETWNIIVDRRFLHPNERFSLFAFSGGSSMKIILPYADGLPILTPFHILFTSSTTPTQVLSYGTDGTDGTAQSVFDINGVPQTTIDHAVANWGASAAIECRLVNNAGNGVWTCYAWSAA